MTYPVIDGGNASTTFTPTGAAPVSGPVFAPTISTYAARAPYLTPGEYSNAATGVDTSNLVPGGSSAQQAAALGREIARASAWADTICRKVLAATRDIQAGRFRVQRDGTMRVPVDYTPLIAVAAVTVGDHPSTAVDLTDLTCVEIGDKVVTVPAFGAARLPSDCYGYGARGHRYCQIAYVNGYANTTVTVATASGASALTVANPLGLFPGMTLTLADGGATEQVTVAASFVPTAVVAPTVVPLTAAMASGHTVGAALSALPEEIKEAVILLTSALIKTRGSEAIEMPGFHGQASDKQRTEAHGLEEVDIALDLLEPHRRAA